jgi:hypothetical protein
MDMKSKITCAYCGRQRPLKKMVESQILRGKMICRQGVTDCLRIRAGAVFARNERTYS